MGVPLLAVGHGVVVFPARRFLLFLSGIHQKRIGEKLFDRLFLFRYGNFDKGPDGNRFTRFRDTGYDSYQRPLERDQGFASRGGRAGGRRSHSSLVAAASPERKRSMVGRLPLGA